MRATLMLPLMLLFPATGTPARAAGDQPMRCYTNDPQLVAADRRARAQRLDQLPPAAEILTVLRAVDGCARPVVVRYGIGGNPPSTPPVKAPG
ncbi:MAG: hypothetical protein JOY99_16680 [Sphingomonadaceae bacterium]|nr:hypothetical protein [Sphingomonadaceae bacterium]